MRAPVLPSARLLSAVLICLISAVLCTVIVRQPPWLGLAFEQTAAGATLRIADVAATDPSKGPQSGDSLIAIGTVGGTPMNIVPGDLLEEPDFLDTWPRKTPSTRDRPRSRPSCRHRPWCSHCATRAIRCVPSPSRRSRDRSEACR